MAEWVSAFSYRTYVGSTDTFTVEICGQVAIVDPTKLRLGREPFDLERE